MSEMTCGLFEQGPVHHFPFPYSRVHVTIYLVARPTRACVVIAPPPLSQQITPVIGKIDTPVTVPRAEPPVRRARVFGTSRGEILRRPRRVPRVTRAEIVVRNLPRRSEPPTRAWTLVHVVIIPPPGFHPVRRSLPEHLWLSPFLPDPVKHRRQHHAQASPLRHRQRRIEQETRNHHGDELPERHH
jgi:hypothetical protein